MIYKFSIIGGYRRARTNEKEDVNGLIYQTTTRRGHISLANATEIAFKMMFTKRQTLDHITADAKGVFSRITFDL